MTQICDCHTQKELRELARALANDMLDRQSPGNCLISIYVQLVIAQKIIGGLMLKKLTIAEMLLIEKAIRAVYPPHDCIEDISIILRERTS